VADRQTGSEARPLDLPAYTAAEARAAFRAAGGSGTVYSLVMPESEAALASVIARDDFYDRYREPWTQKQDTAHELYFERWLDWAAPVVSIRGADFPFRYPTGGASEGIFKLTAEHAASAACSPAGSVRRWSATNGSRTCCRSPGAPR
jgi:hypothetical protein